MNTDGRMCVPRQVAGFTFLETMVCVAVIGVLAAVATPSFRAALNKQRISAVRSELATSIQWARWEALRRNAKVTLLRRTDCASSLPSTDHWDCGWTIVAGDTVTRNTVVVPADVLQTFSVPQGIRLVHEGGGPIFQVSRSGYPVLVANKFVVGTPGAGPLGIAVERDTAVLCMNRTGRIRDVQGQATC